MYRHSPLRTTLYLLLTLALLFTGLVLPGQQLPTAFAGDPDSPLQLREMGVCADAVSRGGAGGLGVLSFGLGIDDTRFDSYNGDFVVAGLPAGATIIEAWLYWNGSDTGNAPEDDPGLFVPNPGNPPDGDPTVTLQALPAGAATQVASVTRIGGPAFWITSDFSYAYRADVSPIVTGNGSYRLAGVNNLDNYINGAELVLVYRDTTRDPYYFGIAEGLDLAEGNSSPSSGPGTKAVVYQFEPAEIARTAQVTVFLGGAGFSADGETSFWYRSDIAANLPITPTDTSIISDPLATEVPNPFDGFNNQATSGTPTGASGGYWDSVTFNVAIPAGDSWLAVQVESQDTTPTLDRIEWVGAVMNMPLACPAVQVTKTRTSPDFVQSGETITFQLLVENVGDTSLTDVVLQDLYDTTYLAFASAVAAPNDATNDGQLDWSNVGPLPYGGSTTVTVNFTAVASTEPIVGPPADRSINIAAATVITDTNGLTDGPGNYPADDPNTPEDENPYTDTADVEITDPSLTVVKSVVTPATGIQISGQPIVFDIVVTNDGDTTWNVIPLSDTYTTTHLTYSSATLAPNNATNDGQLDWSDITGAGSLAPGNAITITLTFIANTSTTGLPNNQDFNVATVSNPTDENGDSIDDVTDTEPFRVLTPASLGDRVWVDTNGNGIQNSGEPNRSGVTVNLYAAGDLVTPIATDTTDASGIYGFSNLFPGDYVVEFIKPSGFEFTALDQGANDAVDSDANQTTGRTAAINLSEGENDLTWDAGIYELLDIGDLVWEDINGDGIQSPGELGLNGVAVQLQYAGPDGNFATTGDNTTQNATTNASGAYLFANQPPGTYRILFTAPGGYAFTVQDSAVPGATDANDSDANPATGLTASFAVTSGNDDLTRDAGLYQPASLGNFVWEDINGDGIQTGESGNGISGVNVELQYAGPDGSFATAGDNSTQNTTTNASGAYLFSNLIPGAYRVLFTAPSGHVFTLQDSTVSGANDTNDSDVNPATGLTIQTSLVSGENDLTWDAGLYRPASLGNFVWEDMNGDGIQTGESGNGISSVAVQLQYAGPDGSFGTGDDATQNTTTNVSGAYLFSNLSPGNYRVLFTAPGGYVFTLQDSALPGANDTNDSDANPATGLTIQTSLVSGESDLTWDAGLYRPITLGDTIFRDPNANTVQDVGENDVVPNVPITLTNLTTGLVFNATSDNTSPTGNYLFSNLPPGLYTIDVPANLPLLIRTTPLPGPFLLQSGVTDLTKDFGYINPTAVEIANVEVSAGPEGITLTWQTVKEDLGDSFRIYRALNEYGVRKLVTLKPILAQGSPNGAAYTFLDTAVSSGTDYYYWIEISPQGTLVGPIYAPYRDDPGGSGGAQIFIPLVVR